MSSSLALRPGCGQNSAAGPAQGVTAWTTGAAYRIKRTMSPTTITPGKREAATVIKLAEPIPGSSTASSGLSGW